MKEGWTGGDQLRHFAQYYRADDSFELAKVGRNVWIHCQAIVARPENVEIGDNVRIDAFSILSANKIVIGSNVHIGAQCHLSGPDTIEFADFSNMSHQSMILTATDDVSVAALAGTTVPRELLRLITGSVKVEKHAIIGAQSLIMPGVTLGFGCVVGAKSFVKDDVEPYSIVGGVPAAHIKARPKHISAEALADLERRCANG